MKKYLLRLDDACEKMDRKRWDRLEQVLDRCGVKPLVGVIPDCKDPAFAAYEEDKTFWSEKLPSWVAKGWTIALHGYDHRYISENGGLNRLHNKSEFAGVDPELQRQKIAQGVKRFRASGIEPKVFFAPSHTFDEQTLAALREESDIRIISDTAAYDVYQKDGFTYVPVQFSYLRSSPYRTTTFCLHPNTLDDKRINAVERFLTSEKERRYFTAFPTEFTGRRYHLIDEAVRVIFFKRRGLSLKKKG